MTRQVVRENTSASPRTLMLLAVLEVVDPVRAAPSYEGEDTRRFAVDSYLDLETVATRTSHDHAGVQVCCRDAEVVLEVDFDGSCTV